MSLKTLIDPNQLPQHVAVIMDGNGRWAKQQGKNRVFGHSNGVRAVRETSEACAELGIPYLTLYAFSTENWSRPEMEVVALMDLLLNTVKTELDTLMKNNIRLKVIGQPSSLPSSTRRELEEAIRLTSGNTRMDLTLALSYSGRWEITQTMKSLGKMIKEGRLDPEQIDENTISAHLLTAGMPDPELLIRTSGEHRISNFLLWQLAYAEFYFTTKFWPEFDREDLYRAIIEFQQRERRFGKTSEQIKSA
jgi:undecaprenyl diphosphate synthase